MGTITVVNNVSLDGVMQAPAAPDEDRRGGFTQGGWTLPYQDQVIADRMSKLMASAQDGSLLLGRRTYEHLYSVWAKQKNNPFSDHLNKVQKYVTSRTLKEPLVWENSTLLSGEATDAVYQLKHRENKKMSVLGSGELIHSLIGRGLIDKFVLLIFPITLGKGRRLFPDEQPVRLLLEDHLISTKGVMIATYQLALT